MQAAHDATQIPLLVGQVFNRVIGSGNTGVEIYEQVDATDQHHPEKEESERTQMIEGIPFRSKGDVEPLFER